MTSAPAPRFPRGFRFGAATAAYQIEGATREDGRGVSIWDTFSRTPGATAEGSTGDIACDHYHRYQEDVALLGELGADTYRFSIAWPRILPTGTGAVNPAGLDFYDRLVDELLAAGIEPAPTLYHWDLPQPLEDVGGWRVRDTAEAFAEYAAVVAERLADRAGRWMTLNEPFCTAFVGHAIGRHAPGTREGNGALAVVHHLLVGHGLAVDALRAAGAREVGIALNPDRLLPATDSRADAEAVARAEILHNRCWFDPIFLGRYPDGEQEIWGDISDFAFRRDGDLELASRPLDFCGVNYYRPITVADAPWRETDPALRTAVDIRAEETWGDDTARRTTMGWPVVPSTFRDLLVDLTRRYPGLPPIVITENGSSEADIAEADGTVHDTDRVNYLRDHLDALAQAIAEGVDVRAYYVWSLLDNFEWAFGYDRRFGIVRVDYDTLKRTPKDSYRWYRDFIAAERAAHKS
ncbi:GH1 family beta-glucosidase [Actinacidiphila acididurans]|uniref:Beta-glucosidase n=1 Tax=Actinacidiphila acididurans TaxID=2784346 RepID=A0ABS2TM15_9ACTN|nr:GH1 family beta-glucosidase [Actinacidiphila acididurans]MBM9504373.1 beta-glucosidase [Actinacidiphila acididurans]